MRDLDQMENEVRVKNHEVIKQAINKELYKIDDQQIDSQQIVTNESFLEKPLETESTEENSTVGGGPKTLYMRLKQELKDDFNQKPFHVFWLLRKFNNEFNMQRDESSAKTNKPGPNK